LILNVFISMKYLLLIVFFSSCAAKKSGISWGGGAGAEIKTKNVNYTVNSTNENKVNNDVQTLLLKPAVDSPGLSKIAIRAKQKRQSLGFSVDTIPPKALMNNADLKLARAQKLLDKYERNQRNQIANLSIYALLSTPILVKTLILIVEEIQASNKYPFLQAILFLGIIGVVGYWLFGFLVVGGLPAIKANRAYRKIKIAPKHAPDSRRIEYEVRVLLMLNNVMSEAKQIKRIKRIKELSQTDPYNPWLKRLEELRFYQVSQLSGSRDLNSSSNKAVLLPLLGPLLILLSKWINR